MMEASDVERRPLDPRSDPLAPEDQEVRDARDAWTEHLRDRNARTINVKVMIHRLLNMCAAEGGVPDHTESIFADFKTSCQSQRIG